MAADEKEELAESRTNLAEDRTVLANERTFAGWLRTGLTAVGIGLGFTALFKTMEPVWVAKSIATSFLLIAIFIFIAAERRACAVIHRLDTHKVQTVKIFHLRVMTGAMVAATAALIAALWMLNLTGGAP